MHGKGWEQRISGTSRRARELGVDTATGQLAFSYLPRAVLEALRETKEANHVEEWVLSRIGHDSF
jgi:hypothetical protein